MRNAEYIRFRRLQLQSIEAKLPGLSTFQNVYRAFYQCQPVSLAALPEPFAVKACARTASTAVEGRLPVLIGGVWLLTAVISAALLIRG
jgi:hypothetical protein